ncbi:hypothetical protein ACHHYP_05774 [Achlya hypogyna]|uniref:Ion transport domain-containing protein n=1 Tax=Achlya hypogyna TaxID=1202772 RepID=A0A1V9YWF2_ACHHY|nr:hypothetical protein ACHHYP_05774 [Achlya hypogyna]
MLLPVDICEQDVVRCLLETEARFRREFPLHYLARNGRLEPVKAWVDGFMAKELVHGVGYEIDAALREQDSTTEARLTVLMHAANALDDTAGDQVLEYLLRYAKRETILARDNNRRTVLDYLLDKKIVRIKSAPNASNDALLRCIESVCRLADVVTQRHWYDLASGVISSVARQGWLSLEEMISQVGSGAGATAKFANLAASRNWGELQTLLKRNPHQPSINEYDDDHPDSLSDISKLDARVLHRVAENGHVPTLQLLLQQTELDIDRRMVSVILKSELTAVTLAATANRVNCVRLLLQAGAELDPKDTDMTETQRATANSSQNLILDYWKLVQKHPSYAMTGLVNVQAADDAKMRNQGPMHVAVRVAQPEYILEAVFAETKDVDAQDKNGMTALMAAAHEGHLTNVRFLLRDDVAADVDERDKTGKTALMYAASAGHVEVVAALVEAFADLDIKDTKGKSVMHHITTSGGSKSIAAKSMNPDAKAAKSHGDDRTNGTGYAMLPEVRIRNLLEEEAQMRTASPEYKEKLTQSMISLTIDDVFRGNGFAKALACDPKLGEMFLNDCVRLNRHEAQFFNVSLDLVYGKQATSSALHAVLSLWSEDTDQAILAKDCLEHIVMRRLLEIKWELFGQRKYIEQLLMNRLLLLTMTTSSILFNDEEPPVVVFYFGLTAITFVAVALCTVQALRPKTLWNLTRVGRDRWLWIIPEKLVTSNLPSRKLFVRWCLCALALTLTIACVVPMVLVMRQLDIETWFPPVNHCVLMLTTLYFIWHEGIEMRSSGLKYFMSRMNRVQLLIYSMILVIFVPMKFGLIDAAFELQVGVGGFLTLALWVMSLQFLEVVPSASYLLPMMADLFSSIYNFFILFAVLQVGITITYYQLFRRHPEGTTFSTLGQSFLTSYFVTFGQVPLDALRAVANSPSSYAESTYVAIAGLMMLHSAVVVVVLLNVLIALMNETVTSGLAKAKTQALASFASCILRLETAMNLSAADTFDLIHLEGPNGDVVLNPIFMERVPKSLLGLSTEQSNVLLTDAADRRQWSKLVHTIEGAIDREIKFLVDSLNNVNHFSDINAAGEFEEENRIITAAQARLKDVVADARKRRGQYKDKELTKIRARVNTTMTNLKKHLLARWKPKPGEDLDNHDKCVLLLGLSQRSGVATLLDHAGQKPLHIAVQSLNRRAVTLLLRAGANVDTLDASGSSPLHVLARISDGTDDPCALCTELLAANAAIDIHNAVRFVHCDKIH